MSTYVNNKWDFGRCGKCSAAISTLILNLDADLCRSDAVADVLEIGSCVNACVLRFLKFRRLFFMISESIISVRIVHCFPRQRTISFKYLKRSWEGDYGHVAHMKSDLLYAYAVKIVVTRANLGIFTNDPEFFRPIHTFLNIAFGSVCPHFSAVTV